MLKRFGDAKSDPEPLKTLPCPTPPSQAPGTPSTAQRPLGSNFGAVRGPCWNDCGTHFRAILEPYLEQIFKPAASPLIASLGRRVSA